MNKGVIFLIGITFCVLNACRTGGEDKDGRTFEAGADYVQIILFHLEQRCESCNAVERETERLLEKEYAMEVLSGKIRFVPLNFQSQNGKKAAAILRASGQTLFVVKGDSISDLTSRAFMYASTHPAYYREALREVLDYYLE